MHQNMELKADLYTLADYHIVDNGVINELLRVSHRCDKCDPSLNQATSKSFGPDVCGETSLADNTQRGNMNQI
jgi:hypothetical protein